MKARNKQTGEIVEIKVYNNMYAVNGDKFAMYSKTLFDTLYEEVEDPNHPYGGMEVLDNVPPETWEDRFNTEFVDEDTGLLNISKYDHERIINFIKNEIK